MANPTAEQQAALVELYIAILDRAPDQGGIAFWADKLINLDGGDLEATANRMWNAPQVTGPEGEYGGLTVQQTITRIYENVLNRTPDADGLAHWTNVWNNLGPGQTLLNMIDNLKNNPNVDPADAALFAAKVELGTWFAFEYGSDDVAEAEQAFSYLEDDGFTVAQAQAALTAEPPPDTTLTNKQDDLTGSDGDDVFEAPQVQNDLGGVTNSLASGDKVDGGVGTDALYADIIWEDTSVGGYGEVITPDTTSVENIFITQQAGYVAVGEDEFFFDFFDEIQQDYGEEPCDDEWEEFAPAFKSVAYPHIDAQDMKGVEQYWSYDSRADLYIEDVRQRPQDVIIGMSGTDPQVSYLVDFDSDVIAGDFGNSAVTYEFANLLQPQNELQIGETGDAGWVASLEFTLNGETYVVNGGDVSSATTYAELEAAVEASLADLGLTGLEVSLDETFLNPVNGEPGATLTIFDPDGGIFTNPITNVADGATTGALYFDAEIGAPEVLDVQTNVVLDNVGRNDQGGILDIGGMSNQGIEIFNVEVDRKSWLASMSSTSRIVDPQTGTHHHLEVVNLSHVEGGAMGDLVLGSQLNPMDTDVNPTTLPTGARVQTNGLIDVREFNAAGFEGALNIGARLTDYSIARYLDTSGGEVVNFNYTMGDGGSLLTLAIDDDLSQDALFALNLMGGDGDDRFNLVQYCDEAFDFDAITIDGGAGFNILEVHSDIGLDGSPSTIPAGFANIDRLILAGNNDVDADFSNLPGVTELVIATGEPGDGDYSSSIFDLDASQTSVTVSGKNQTKGIFNADNNQSFDDIFIGTVDGEELLINIENTARTSGELYIDDLEISAPETVILDVDVSDSDRVNSQTIYIEDFLASGTSTLMVQGTLDTTINDVDDFGAAGAPVLITAEDLEGSFRLGVDADWITQHDADEGSELIGTDGSGDVLEFKNGVLNTTVDTQVSGFETIEFDDVEGTFDAGAVSGEEIWDIQDTTDFFSLINLSGDNIVMVDVGNLDGDAPSLGGGGDEVLFEGGASGMLTLQLYDMPTSGGDRALIQGFRDIVLDFEGGVDQDQSFFITHLDADGQYFLNDGLDDDPDVSTPAYDPEEVTARTLTVTGGAVDDDLDLGILSNVLTTIDVSGYAGDVTFTLGVYGFDVSGTDFLLDRNTTIVVGSEDLMYSENQLDGPTIDAIDSGEGDSHITTFRFTTDARDTDQDWILNDFNPFADESDSTPDDDYDLTNLSVLDVRALGIEGFADLSIAQVGADTVITSDTGMNFEIVLVGIEQAALSNENFLFATA